MDEMQDDIDSAAQAQQGMEEARRRREQDPEIAFWIRIHDATIARHRADDAQMKALNYALDKLFP